MKKKAIVLTSGGLDSTTTMAIADNLGFKLFSLSFDYGQRHKIELQCAKQVSKKYNVGKHLIINVNMRDIGGSSLTENIDVPKNRKTEDMSIGIPNTYVPARNTIFLSYALAWAEVIDVRDIFIGVNALDYSGYPDCRPEFIQAYENMANFATKFGVEGDKVKINAPLINLTKAQIISKGMELNVDYSLTHSCYDPTPEGLSCGECDSCQLRLSGFKEAGYQDPIHYANHLIL